MHSRSSTGPWEHAKVTTGLAVVLMGHIHSHETLAYADRFDRAESCTHFAEQVIHELSLIRGRLHKGRLHNSTVSA